MSHALECYNVTAEEEDEDLQKIKIPGTKGHREVQVPQIENRDITASVKTKHVNIGMEEEHNFANIGDWWDNTTVDKVVELLREYQNLFLTKFKDLKRIIRYLGVMKIMLKLDSKPVK